MVAIWCYFVGIEDYAAVISNGDSSEKLGVTKEGLFIEFVSFVNNPDRTPKYDDTLQYVIQKKEWIEHEKGKNHRHEDGLL